MASSPRSLPPVPNLDRLEFAVLIELYAARANNGDTHLTISKVLEAYNGIPGHAMLYMLSVKANKSAYYMISTNGDYLLSKKGLDFMIDSQYKNAKFINDYFLTGPYWIYDKNPIDLSEESPVSPEWEPLPIDREDEKYKIAVAATHEALEAIEGSNGFAETTPEERDGIVLAIRGTLNSIENGQPDRRFILSGLLEPLKRVAAIFRDSAVSELAKSAIRALLDWLGNP